VTTSPSSLNLTIGGTGTVTAYVSGGSAAVQYLSFGSYYTNVATVNPTLVNPYSPSTTVTAVAQGTAAVWATAVLSDGTVCQSTSDTDTNINVVGGGTCTPGNPYNGNYYSCTDGVGHNYQPSCDPSNPTYIYTYTL
jgi:hypothetical protein